MWWKLILHNNHLRSLPWRIFTALASADQFTSDRETFKVKNRENLSKFKFTISKKIIENYYYCCIYDECRRKGYTHWRWEVWQKKPFVVLQAWRIFSHGCENSFSTFQQRHRNWRAYCDWLNVRWLDGELIFGDISFRLNWRCGILPCKTVTNSFARCIFPRPMFFFCASTWIHQNPFKML